MLNAALDEASEKEALRSFPLALGGVLLLLLVLLRSVRASLVAMVCSGFSVLLTVGLMGFLGYSFNMVTAVLPALLWVLSLSYSIHLLMRYRRARLDGMELFEAIQRALLEVRSPCLFSALTTAIGFLSLVFSSMPPVREMGLFAAPGILMALVVNLTLAPQLIAWARPPGREASATFGRLLLTQVSGASVRRPRSVALVFAGLILASLISTRFITVESNPLAFLPSNSRVVKDYAFVRTSLTGLSSLELVIRTPKGWTDSQYWPILEGLKAHLEELPAVSRVISPLDFLKKANQWENGLAPSAYHLPASESAAQALIAGLSARNRAGLGRFVSGDGREIRLSVLVNRMESSVFLGVVQSARTGLNTLPAGMTGFSTGIVLELVDAQRKLVTTQLESFGVTFLLVFACILAGLQSWRLMLISVAPSVMAILTAFALMAWCGIPLDAATVMVASVALGIAVDNTIHLLSEFARVQRRAPDACTAVSQALQGTGSAMTIASITSSMGFFVLCSSSFLPIRYFGLLSGAALLVALVADLVLAPALMVLFGGCRTDVRKDG